MVSCKNSIVVTSQNGVLVQESIQLDGDDAGGLKWMLRSTRVSSVKRLVPIFYRARHNDVDLSLEVLAEIHALVSSSFEVASEPPEVGETIHLVE